MAARTGNRAEEDVRRAFAEVGLRPRRPRRGEAGVDLVVPLGDGAELGLELKAFAAPTPAEAAHLVRGRKLGRGTVGLVVADRIGAATRDELRSAGWGWLDRRGHLHIVRPPVVIDTPVTPVPSALPPESFPTEPLRSAVAQEVATELLMAPAERPSVRAMARQLGRSPAAVSKALAAMRASSVIDEGNQPLIPELFWELAGVWHPTHYMVAGVPDPADRHDQRSFELGTEDLRKPGWALSDTVAAAAYGADVVTTADYPPDLYAPTERIATRAIAHFGRARDDRAASVAAAPVPAVATRRFPGPGPWPLAHPVIVALDLARDRGRGREILEHWEPPAELGVTRVW
jgi:hypothetical protein